MQHPEMVAKKKNVWGEIFDFDNYFATLTPCDNRANLWLDRHHVHRVSYLRSKALVYNQ